MVIKLGDRRISTGLTTIPAPAKIFVTTNADVDVVIFDCLRQLTLMLTYTSSMYKHGFVAYVERRRCRYWVQIAQLCSLNSYYTVDNALGELKLVVGRDLWPTGVSSAVNDDGASCEHVNASRAAILGSDGGNVLKHRQILIVARVGWCDCSGHRWPGLIHDHTKLQCHIYCGFDCRRQLLATCDFPRHWASPTANQFVGISAKQCASAPVRSHNEDVS